MMADDRITQIEGCIQDALTLLNTPFRDEAIFKLNTAKVHCEFLRKRVEMLENNYQEDSLKQAKELLKEILQAYYNATPEEWVGYAERVEKFLEGDK